MFLKLETSSNLGLGDSVTDFVLQRVFALSRYITQYTLVRLCFVIFLLPVYLYVQILSSLPSIIRNFVQLFSVAGRRRLYNASDKCRQDETRIAEQQWHDTYRFQQDTVVPGSDKATSWHVPSAWVSVCGISARVVHMKPQSPCADGKQILLLHGNPSWSFIWRDIVQPLAESGHEVFALDWLGHGASDKPTSVREISFELHMRTLLNVVEEFDLKDFYIAAHDWGGCIALCTLPHLPLQHRCQGLLLLNSFLPARPSDITVHSYLLYVLWFLSTGILGLLVPEAMVMRFMAPNITSTIAQAYWSPYESTPLSAKASISRFSHIVPGLPDFVLNLRPLYLWHLVEGFLGPERFTNITAQARLAERDRRVREWWAGTHSSRPSDAKLVSGERLTAGDRPTAYVGLQETGPMSSTESANPPKSVFVVFGPDDPLLPDFKRILEKSLTVTSCLSPDLDYSMIPAASQTKQEDKSTQDTRTYADADAVQKGTKEVEEERTFPQRPPRFNLVASGSGSVVRNGWLTVAHGTAGHYPMEAEGAPEVIAGAIDVLIDRCTGTAGTAIY